MKIKHLDDIDYLVETIQKHVHIKGMGITLELSRDTILQLREDMKERSGLEIKWDNGKSLAPITYRIFGVAVIITEKRE